MSAQIVNLPFVTLIVQRINDYTVNHQSGTDNIPHLCVKVKHANGFAWFGINVMPGFEQRNWTSSESNQVRERFLDAIHLLTDVVEMVSNVDRLMDSLQSIVSGHKRSIQICAPHNEFLQCYLNNNIQLDVYREEVNEEIMSYGGFFFTVNIRNQDYPGFLYHRGIILYNYIDEDEAKLLISSNLDTLYPELIGCDLEADDIIIHKVVERTRNRANRREYA
ncbi:hypothetical protein AVT69_gp349 [Pseudomonas phage PhiPA3]|uniref:Uncharacterized protein 351 n=1 Tax=Pseudomonas phage PhiPA3 TaxID=998086 RepID=F8SJI5_BPPA3|nr:hypothetical protein AVT69_gp349 [Pseudomonas phage PhiPA3]AEH03774.1 hypothetical protein [Pseudomonas phage PhiPA3]